MSDFETREQAAESKAASVRLQLMTFCPLIKDYCRVDCECFCPGKIWEPCGKNPTVFRVTRAGCGNAMFSGERE